MPTTTKANARKFTPKPKRDLDAEHAAKIIQHLENGTAPWRAPYLGGGLPRSISTGKRYGGINVLLLGMAGQDGGYASMFWGTYNAIQEAGGQVRKGERGTEIVLFKSWSKTEKDAKSGEDVVKGGLFRTAFRVFNAEQADGLPEKFYAAPRTADHDPIAEAEAIVSGYSLRPAIVSERQDVAFYRPFDDVVSVPRRENISGAHEYYSTLFHELTHSTGAAKRLNREGVASLQPHGRGELYAFEELVAEFGAGMLCGRAGITDTFENSAAYLRSWAKRIASDPTLIAKAASAAQKAVSHIIPEEG